MSTSRRRFTQEFKDVLCREMISTPKNRSGSRGRLRCQPEPGGQNVSLVGGVDVGFLQLVGHPAIGHRGRREALTARVHYFFEDSDGTYGYRRIHFDLAEEGTECSPELVRQIMRSEGLVACRPRQFRVTTAADAEAAASMPDLGKRDFTADRPGVKFVGDITYSAQ